tara:strand:- start:260 stop:520 length:261 start_codon:yes stop_codon:yes gene_type:complete
LTLIFSGCASVNNDSVPISYSEECSKDIEIIQSYGDTLRIEYHPKNKIQADQLGSNYCLNERKKISSKNQVNCDGCCRATYICKSN